MAKIFKSADELIGKTPLLALSNIAKKYALNTKILAKLEYFNPAGSVKDRVAKAMLDEAESAGRISRDSVIIEPTSGNTGIGLASVATARGYRCIIVMPDTMSVERCKLMRAYGAEVILTDGSLGMKGAIDKARELSQTLGNAYLPDQFQNPSNPMAHRLSTGPEIYEDTDGQIDAFVAGVGTGGTITGVGEYLKSKNREIHIVGVEPLDSAVLSGGTPGTHKLQGIGAGFVPSVLNVDIMDEIISVSTEEAYTMVREIGKCEGILVGISSGAAVFAATKLATRPEFYNKTIVVLLPDAGDRYLSTADLFL